MTRTTADISSTMCESANSCSNPSETKVAEINDKSAGSLGATDDQEVAITTFKKYVGNVLPVIDSEDRLLGIVTVVDILDVHEKETTEDNPETGRHGDALDEPYNTNPAPAG